MSEKKKKAKKRKNEVMIAVTNLDEKYENGKLMFSAGRQNTKAGDVGSIASPISVRNIKFSPDLPDPVFLTYPYSTRKRARVLGLLAEITSEGGTIPSSCVYRLIEVPSPVSRKWKKLSGKITLKHNGASIFTDPRGIANLGDYIFGIDYDSMLLTILGLKELWGASGNCVPVNAPYDLTSLLGTAGYGYRGQSIIALGNKLYPLYIDTNPGATVFAYSKIARLSVSGAALTGGVAVYVGRNAQETAPVIDSLGNTQLLIPAIGGMQNAGSTNGIASKICILPAEGNWTSLETAPILVTGDPNGIEGDIHDLAVACRDENSLVFILLTMYNQTYDHLDYTIYQGTVKDVLSLLDSSQQNIPTISGAVTANKLVKVDDGIIASPTAAPDPSGLYHPCISMIQHPTNPEKDLLVFVAGSQIMVSRAAAYGSPTALGGFKVNPYVMFNNNGGVNLNSIEFPIETLYESIRGKGSFRRGVRMSRAADAAAAAKAAAEAEAGEDKK